MSIIRFIFEETDKFSVLCKKEKIMEPFAPKPVNDCYHVYSDGTRVVVLCDTDEDCIYMMNQIAVASYFCHLKILALEVMRTHFHVVIRGAPDKVEKFRRELKRLIVKRYKRDGLGDLVKNSIDIQVDRIKDEEELRRKIIYVYRNCTEAGFEFMPEDYPWGPGQVYCREEKSTYNKVGSLDYRDSCRLFRTRVKLPPEWEYDEKGMLVPASYIDKEYLRNKVFVSPRQFIAFLNVRKKDLADMEAADARPFLEKKDESMLLKEVEAMSRTMFGKEVAKLTQANKLSLAVKLWTDMKTTSVKQLARLTRNDVDVLRAVLHVPLRE